MTDGKVKKIVRYLSFNNHLLLMLMKLKLGLRNKDLVFWFQIKPMADYRIFWGLVTDSRRIFAVFDSVVRKRNNHKTSAKKLQKIPKMRINHWLYRAFYSATIKFECSDTNMEHNTTKYLISTTPAGVISFTSKEWAEGSQITKSQLIVDICIKLQMVTW